MRRTLGVGVVLLLAILLIPSTALGQQGGSGRASRLDQNYPNPFNPTTTIPFTLFPEDFVNGKAAVTIRVLNIQAQLVAYPMAVDPPGGGSGVLVENLTYTEPGPYKAYWEGMDRLGKKVGSGMYLVELVINGRRLALRKIVVAK